MSKSPWVSPTGSGTPGVTAVKGNYVHISVYRIDRDCRGSSKLPGTGQPTYTLNSGRLAASASKEVTLFMESPLCFCSFSTATNPPVGTGRSDRSHETQTARYPMQDTNQPQPHSWQSS